VSLNRYQAAGPKLKLGSVGGVSQFFQVTQKERYRASPYGFGTNPENYSPSQWAILAALGLTKGGNKLP